jgi:DNA-damage-inducible protein D
MWESAMTDEEVFSANPEDSLFEKSSIENGTTYWLASTLMSFLGYDDPTKFRKAISKAQIACATLETLKVEEHFIGIVGEDGQPDTKLTRVACYFVVMSADVTKPEVAKAQMYFIALAQSVQRYREEAENVTRIQVRSEIKDREISLAGTAAQAGVVEYPPFHNAGYRGMYDMNIWTLREMRQIPSKRSPLDFMGSTELAANLFRVTQTEEKVRKESIKGQVNAQQAAEFVGKAVRKTMKETGGTLPENLPQVRDIKEVRKEIKQTTRTLKQIDSRKKPKQ